ncbi:MAG TPA: TonB family protein [Longimicrobiaceae bacterium]
MFNKLVASQPRGRRQWSPTTIGVSVVVHALLLAGAVYASVTAPAEAAVEEEEITFFEIPEEPPAPEPTTPEPPPPVQETTVPPPPQGFQELVPPIEPPAVIPEVDPTLPPVNPEDFSGIGEAGGTADGVEGGTPQDLSLADSLATHAFEVGVLQRPPELRNKNQVASYMERNYPRNLQDAGIGGTVTLQFVVEADGTVNPQTVEVLNATHPQFESVSRQVVERFRFRPGIYRDQEVRVLVRMPITWQPQR